jgi:hypothetical protein
MKAAWAWVAAAALAWPSVGTWADELPTVSVHGFVSQGFLKTSANQYLVPSSDKGSFAFTEEALNFNVSPRPGLRIGAQFFARDVGREGNHRVTIDWALADYRWRNALGVRFGKLKLATNLYNDLIDTDAARPEIFQPAGLYSATQRDFRTAFNGASVYGTVRAFDYHLMVGAIDFDNTYLVRELIAQAALGVLPAIGLTQGDYNVPDPQTDSRRLVAGTLQWNTPVRGLRTRVSFASVRMTATSPVQLSGRVGALPVSLTQRIDIALDVPSEWTLSGEYQRGPWRLVAEGQHRAVDILTGIGSSSSKNELRSLAWYGRATYRVKDRVDLSGAYSEYYPDRRARDVAWHKDLSLTARWDVTPNWLFKVELHDIDGTAELSDVENAGRPVRNDWRLLALRTTFHF